jgi:hypothetical protein
MSTAEKLLLILRMQGAGGGGATWNSVMTSYSPVFWYKLDEAASPVANSGSAGGTGVITGGAFRAGSLNDPNAGIAMDGGERLNVTTRTHSAPTRP